MLDISFLKEEVLILQKKDKNPQADVLEKVPNVCVLRNLFLATKPVQAMSVMKANKDRNLFQVSDIDKGVEEQIITKSNCI